MLFAFDSVPDQYKTQEICYTIAFEGPFLIIFVLINVKLKECLTVLFLKTLL